MNKLLWKGLVKVAPQSGERLVRVIQTTGTIWVIEHQTYDLLNDLTWERCQSEWVEFVLRELLKKFFAAEAEKNKEKPIDG